MQFPEPTVDIDEIKRKYHAIVAEEGREDAEEPGAASEPKKDKKHKKHKKGKKQEGQEEEEEPGVMKSAPDAPAHHHVHHQVDEMHFGARHLKVWLLSAAGLLMGGYSFVSLGVALPLLGKDPAFPISVWETGAIASAAVLGRMLGAVFFGSLVDRYGRKIMYRLDP